MRKFTASVFTLSLLFVSGCQTSKVLSVTPQVWEGDENGAKITRGAYHSTFDTAEVANQHCAVFGKMAKLREEANVFELPNTDKYDCVKPD